PEALIGLEAAVLDPGNQEAAESRQVMEVVGELGCVGEALSEIASADPVDHVRVQVVDLRCRVDRHRWAAAYGVQLERGAAAGVLAEDGAVRGAVGAAGDPVPAAAVLAVDPARE